MIIRNGTSDDGKWSWTILLGCVMPLRAEWKGEDVFAFDFSPEGFKEFRETVKTAEATLEMPCCGTRACLRISPRGLPHFYHYRRGDCQQFVGESAAHLILKQRIVEACRHAGYEVATEVGGDGFVADVMVELPAATEWRVAFEVQLSWQSQEEMIARHESREAAKIRTCWLSSQPQALPRNGGRVPRFELLFEEVEDEVVRDVEVDLDLQGSAEWGRLSLKEFVSELLKGHLTWKTQCKKAPMREVVYFQYECRECKAPVYVYYYLKTSQRWCECGDWKAYESQAVFPWDPGFESGMNFWAENWAMRLNLPMAKVIRRSGEITFGCPECGSDYGQRRIWKASLSVYYAVNDRTGSYDVVKWCAWPEKGKYRHWCYTGESTTSVSSPEPTEESSEIDDIDRK